LNIGFLVSHEGSNAQAIIDACKNGTLSATPSVIISNNSNSGVISRAKLEGIPFYHLSSTTYPHLEKLDEAILNTLHRHNVDIVVLAGYMKKLGPKTLADYKGAVLNIHPSLLPRFGGEGMYGIRVHEAVLLAKEKETGVSIHLADGDYDTGKVIAQMKIPVLPDDTPETLQARVLQLKHSLFPKTLQKIVSGEIVLPNKTNNLIHN
jgi:phosphoribosylglycinamide formyltransferase 1